MKASLEEYTVDEISAMKKPLGNKNYDVYDIVMTDICYKFDDLIMKDDDLKKSIDEYTQLRQLNFFLMSFVSNKKMALTEREQVKLRESIYNVDQAALRNPNCKAYKAYNQAYRKCMLEFLKRSARFELNEPTNKIIR